MVYVCSRLIIGTANTSRVTWSPKRKVANISFRRALALKKGWQIGDLGVPTVSAWALDWAGFPRLHAHQYGTPQVL